MEHVWWPVVGNFEDLHPEYEFVDEDGNYYYLDYAYMRFPKPTDLEADGFSSHARDADRRSFNSDRRRQNAIALDNWNILRFSVDDLKEDAAYCRRTLIRMLERWYGAIPEQAEDLSLYHREIVRLATRLNKPFTPCEVSNRLGISDRYARDLLHQLVLQRFLEPASGEQRIRSYRLRKRK